MTLLRITKEEARFLSGALQHVGLYVYHVGPALVLRRWDGAFTEEDRLTAEAVLDRGAHLPLYELINGQVGPFSKHLFDAWESAGIGGACKRCGGTIEEYYWSHLVCATCAEQYDRAIGRTALR